MKMTMKRLHCLTLDVFFPNRCVSCGKHIPADGVFCGECVKKLEFLPDIPWQAMFPPEIKDEVPCFDYANSLFFYEGTARQAVLNFKDGYALRLAGFAADRLCLKLESDEVFRIDLVTSVPMHRFKRWERGYDQAEVFAREVADKLSVEYDGSILGHRHSHIAQHERGMEERLRSANRTYYAKEPKRDLSGKNLLICDDILTTGATLGKCSEILKQLGAEKVGIVTICLTDTYGRILREHI